MRELDRVRHQVREHLGQAVAVRADGYGLWRDEVTIEAHGTTTITPQLERAATIAGTITDGDVLRFASNFDVEKFATEDKSAPGVYVMTGAEAAVIKKAEGGGGEDFSVARYEGFGPGGCMVIVECLTDNRNRTIAEVRKIFDKNSGQVGTSGSAAWAFEQKGIMRIDKDAASEDELFEAAVGGGAENMELVGDQWVVTTARNDLDLVRDAIATSGIAVGEAALEYIPNNPKVVEGADAEKLIGLYEALEDHDDIQNVFSDFELSEQALAEMA